MPTQFWKSLFQVIFFKTHTLFLVTSYLLLVTSSSCEKDINIKLEPSAASLVVEATIENGKPPLVTLSKSLDYFSKIDTTVLYSSFIHQAIIQISEGLNKVTLQEDSIVNAAGNKIYFYTIPKGSTFVGALNKSYSMQISVAGQIITANTTIPAATRRIDSLWWEKVAMAKDTNSARVVIRATDKPGLGDCIRFFTSVNKGPFLPGFNSVFDDMIIDGTTYTVAVDKGFDKNQPIKPGDAFFAKGDTVSIKLCNIDRATYDFWRTFEFNFQAIGNPFSGPTKILSNLNGNAIGYFGGYAAQYRVIVLK